MKVNLNAETVEILLRACVLGMRAWEQSYARMNEAIEEASTQNNGNGDGLQQGVLIERQDTEIAKCWANVLDLEEAMRSMNLGQGEA